MKRALFLFVFNVMVCSTYSYADDSLISKYRTQVQKCDDTVKEKNESDDITVAQMRRNFSEQFGCYQDVIDDILNDFFAADSDIKKHSNEFLRASVNVSNSIYDSDIDCYPQCGTMTIEQGQITNLEITRKYIDILIDQAESIQKLRQWQ